MSNMIMTEQTLTFSALQDMGGVYAHQSTTILLPLVIGESYTVAWDGTQYNCVAEDGGSGMVALGNVAIMMGTGDTGEPFLLGSDGTSVSLFFALNDTSETHTISICEQESNVIVLYDRTGKAVTYSNVETLSTDTNEEGVKATFTRGVLMEGAEIELHMAAGDQEVCAPIGYLIKKATLKKPEKLLPEYIKKNIEIAGVVGAFAGDEMEKTVDLEMATGDQVIEADEDTVLTRVIVRKPEALAPKNIAEGVTIAGIVGTLSLPQLKKMTFGLSSGSSQNINTYRGSDNGYFELDAVVFDGSGETELARVSIGTDTGYKYIYGYDFQKRPEVMPFKPIVHVESMGFKPSEDVQVLKEIYLSDVSENAANCEVNGVDYHRYISGDVYTATIVPFDGYYIPKEIEVTATDQTVEYEYDNYTGALSLVVPQSDVFVGVTAVDTPWLHTPIVLYNESTKSLAVEYIDENAEITNLICNGEIIVELNPPDIPQYGVETVSSAIYGFTLASDGYYTSQNASKSSSYSVCKLVIRTSTECNCTLDCISYGENNYDYGILSVLDKTLSLSSSADSSNVYKNFKGLSSSNVQQVTYNIPAGEHFIYIKYIKDSSGNSYNDSLKFKVNLQSGSDSSYDLLDYFSYGSHQFEIQSFAEGYTSSDLVEYSVELLPVIEISSVVLTILNLDIARTVNIMIDNESVEVLDCSDVDMLEIDLTKYNLSVARHSVYVVVTDNDGNQWNSNTIEDGVCFAFNSLEEATFSEIDTISKLGIAQNAYSVGDTKTFQVGSLTWTCEIVGFNHDDLADGSGKAGITFAYLKDDITSQTWTPSYASHYSYTWEQCYMRVNILAYDTSFFPSEMQEVLKPVSKKYYDFVNDEIKQCTDTLWLFSTSELGFVGDSFKLEGERYEKFSPDKAIYTPYPELVMRKSDSISVEWWTRSKIASGNAYVYGIDTTGNCRTAVQSSGKRLVVGFCI